MYVGVVVCVYTVACESRVDRLCTHHRTSKRSPSKYYTTARYIYSCSRALNALPRSPTARSTLHTVRQKHWAEIRSCTIRSLYVQLYNMRSYNKKSRVPKQFPICPATTRNDDKTERARNYYWRLTVGFIWVIQCIHTSRVRSYVNVCFCNTHTKVLERVLPCMWSNVWACCGAMAVSCIYCTVVAIFMLYYS